MHRHIARMERSLRGLTWDAPVHIFDVVAIRQVTDNELGLARVIVHREFNGIFQILAEGVKIGAASVGAFHFYHKVAITGILPTQCF